VSGLAVVDEGACPILSLILSNKGFILVGRFHILLGTKSSGKPERRKREVLK